MKIEMYKNNNKKKKNLLIALCSLGVIGISLVIGSSFAKFSENKNFKIIEGNIDYYGDADIIFSYFDQNSEELETMPTKESNLAFDYGNCDNNEEVTWNDESWGPKITNITNSKTRCNIYFKEASVIGTELLEQKEKEEQLKENPQLMYDDTADRNLRYVSRTPNNYIDIGDRTSDGQPILWRIIGVMKNVTSLDDGSEKQEDLIKIIRADSIGSYSWDTSASEVNKGDGINEWSQADLMKLLNPESVYTC